eukprot:TRINITY_DN6952_c0_g2_i3.p2 TRINITY_DN6952_c0_g2~~TRINITY_DN6952_c0_g2_i3.p2  ORF type:complete len:395 (+),score=46.61 TRINITY_DN6952_c0_g2_i3:223-1407(+)
MDQESDSSIPQPHGDYTPLMTMTSVRKTLDDYIFTGQPDNFDTALEKVGDAHTYQYRLVFFHSLQNLVISFFFIAIPFLFYPVTFNCERTNEGGEQEIYQCTENNGGCALRNINEELSPNSLTREFDLYCDQAYWRDLPGVLFFFVAGATTLILGYYSDYYGRKWPLFISIFIPGSLVLIASFASSYMVFLLCYGFCGFVFPYLIIFYAHINESAGDHFRVSSTIFIDVCFTLGQLIFILFAHFELDWRMLTRYYIAAPTLLCCLTYIWIFESPRYLFAVGKYKEYKQVLLQIANTNGIWVDDLYIPGETSSTLEAEEFDAKDMVSYLDLLRFKSLRTITILMCINCIMLNFNYFGLFFTIDKLGPDVALNTFMISLGDVAGCAIASTSKIQAA